MRAGVDFASVHSLKRIADKTTNDADDNNDGDDDDDDNDGDDDDDDDDDDEDDDDDDDDDPSKWRNFTSVKVFFSPKFKPTS